MDPGANSPIGGIFASNPSHPIAKFPGQRLGAFGIQSSAQAGAKRGARPGRHDPLRQFTADGSVGSRAKSLHFREYLREMGRSLVLG